MCFNWFKPKPPESNIKSEKGIVCFPWDDELSRIREDLAPQWVRLGIDQGVNFSSAIDLIYKFRNQGIVVVLCIIDKSNVFNTVNLCSNYARELRDNVWYEVLNEQNSPVDTFVPVKTYVDIYNACKTAIKTYNSNSKVIIGGLNNEIKKNKSNEIKANEYLTSFINYGCKTDAWNWHNYSLDNKFDTMVSTCRKLDPKIPIMLSEFPGRTIKEYNTYMTKFSKNWVNIAIVYSWQGPDWGIKDKPEVLNYIKNY
jgi:hypothetical protein